MSNSKMLTRNLTFVFTILASVFAVTGAAGSYWIANGSNHCGLWRAYYSDPCYIQGDNGRFHFLQIVLLLFERCIK